MQLISAQNTEHQTNFTVIISDEVLAQISAIELTLIHITYYIYRMSEQERKIYFCNKTHHLFKK